MKQNPSWKKKNRILYKFYDAMFYQTNMEKRYREKFDKTMRCWINLFNIF